MKLVLIDYSSIAHPLWHVHGASSDPSATSTAIVAKVRELASGQPHVALCIDTGKSFRNDISAAYKAQREARPAALYYNMDAALDVLRADGFPVWGAKGYEADDVVATACGRALNCKRFTDGEYVPADVLIVSADKDLAQLISERVTCFSPMTGKTRGLAEMQADFGIQPHQVVDFLSLVGDASDNIKGAENIGVKTAAKLLNTFGNLDDLYATIERNPKAVTEGVLKSLTAFKPRLAEARSLLTLKTDAPIPFEQIFAERVPADVATFGDDIEFSMPTLSEERDYRISEIDHHGDPHTLAILASSTETEALKRAERSRTGWPIRIDIFEHGTYNVAAPPIMLASQRTETPMKSEEQMGFPPEIVERQATPTLQQAVDALPPAQAVKVERAVDAMREAAALVPRVPEVIDHVPVEWELMLEPKTFLEAKDAANAMFQSRLKFGEYGHPAGILATIIAGRELGLPMMAALRAFHIVELKPVMAADYIRARVLQSGLVDYFRPTERTAERATFVIKRKGDPEVSLSYTIEEAMTAGCVKPKSGWEKNPADMLVARASSKLARLVCPEVTFGMYSQEEMEQ